MRRTGTPGTIDRGNDRGFTLMEVAVILLGLAVLAAILVPNLGGFNSMARRVRAKEDVAMICSVLKLMLDDLGESAFFHAGAYASGYASGYGVAGGAVGSPGYAIVEESGALEGGWCDDCRMPGRDCGPDCRDDCGPDCRQGADDCGDDCRHRSDDCGPECGQAREGDLLTTQTFVPVPGSGDSRGGYAAGGGVAGYSWGRTGFYGYPVGLLVGEGDIPGTAIGPTDWLHAQGAFFTRVTTGYYPRPVSFLVDTFNNQLVHGDPSIAYGAYRFGADVGVGSGTPFRWRGPYLADGVSPDPWGNRYMANVYALQLPAPGTAPVIHNMTGYQESFHTAVVCLSAGANEVVDTHFQQPFGWITGGDDITAVLAGAGGIR